MTVSLSGGRGRPSVSQYITLSCISNRIGGDLISTALWTGIRLKDLLEEVGLQPEARSLYIEAEDGFYETVIMEDMMDERTLLVYERNGQPLPQEHGFPLRIYIPNRYGMKQPKWIVRIEAVADGPWQEAELRIPPLSPLTWVQWRFGGTFPAGDHITPA